MTAAMARREAKAREVENLLTLTELHRELWNGISKRPELKRIFQADANVLKKPITVAESEFLNLAFVHFQTGWTVARSGALISLSDLKADVREFFALPLPRSVWENTKTFRNPEFARFVNKSLSINHH